MKNSRELVLIDDVLIIGRATAEVHSRLPLEVPPSGISGITVSGGKCEHGVYIPATAPRLDHAPYCSLCHPYEIAVRKNGVYKA